MIRNLSGVEPGCLAFKSSSAMTVTAIEVPVGAMVVVMPARPVVAGVVTPIYWSVIAIPVIRVAVVAGAILVTIDRA